MFTLGNRGYLKGLISRLHIAKQNSVSIDTCMFGYAGAFG